MQRLYAGLGMCVALLGVVAGGTAQATVTFGGQTWNESVDNAAATASGGSLAVEFSDAGRYDLHIQRAEPDPPGINANGTPFLSFSFRIDQLVSGGQIDFYLFTNQEGVPASNDPNIREPSHQAQFRITDANGTQTGQVRGYELAFPGPQGDDTGYVSGSNDLTTEHTLSISKRANGTVVYNLDGHTWTSTWIRDRFGNDFKFNDVHLWVVNKAGDGNRVTFTDFRSSATPVPEPGTLALLGLGGVGLLGGYVRRRKAAA